MFKRCKLRKVLWGLDLEKGYEILVNRRLYIHVIKQMCACTLDWSASTNLREVRNPHTAVENLSPEHCHRVQQASMLGGWLMRMRRTFICVGVRFCASFIPYDSLSFGLRRTEVNTIPPNWFDYFHFCFFNKHFQLKEMSLNGFFENFW